jgi:hypothetical protein
MFEASEKSCISCWSLFDKDVNMKEKFGEQSRPTRQDTTKSLINIGMVEATAVQYHCQDMITSLKVLEVLDEKIDDQSQVDEILRSLSHSFN